MRGDEFAQTIPERFLQPLSLPVAQSTPGYSYQPRGMPLANLVCLLPTAPAGIAGAALQLF